MKDTEGKKGGRQAKGVNVSLDPQMMAWFEKRVESLKRFDAPVRINSNSHYVQELIRRDMMLDLLGGGFLLPQNNPAEATNNSAQLKEEHGTLKENLSHLNHKKPSRRPRPGRP